MRKFLLVAALVAAAACGEKAEDGAMDTTATMAPAATADSTVGAMADSMGKMVDSMGTMVDSMKKMTDTTKM